MMISEGVGPEQFVALALPRSLEMAVGLLAVLKAGQLILLIRIIRLIELLLC